MVSVEAAAAIMHRTVEEVRARLSRGSSKLKSSKENRQSPARARHGRQDWSSRATAGVRCYDDASFPRPARRPTRDR